MCPMPSSSDPVKHVVLTRFKEDTPQEEIDALIAEYAALPKLIPEMKHFEWGTECSVENMAKGFTHCFITTFDSPAGRDIYVPHPAHQAYAKKLIACLADVLVLDFQPN
jgi:hypothetical protein